MMKYYTINPSDDLKVIGHYPQTELRTDEGDNVRVDGYLAMRPDTFPDFVPNLKLELHSEAKPTNFLPNNPTGFGWIVDSKLKNILEKHKLPKHHFYKIKVFHNQKSLNYYWLHYIIDDFYEFIDKDNSYGEAFEMKSPLETTVQSTFPILSWDQVQEEKKKHKFNRTRIGKIVMKKDFPKYDLYQTRCISYISIISESLKNAMEKEHITGIETKIFDKFEVP